MTLALVFSTGAATTRRSGSVMAAATVARSFSAFTRSPSWESTWASEGNSSLASLAGRSTFSATRATSLLAAALE